MTYLNNFIKESLRLNSPVPSTLRVAVKDDVIGKYKIPKGVIEKNKNKKNIIIIFILKYYEILLLLLLLLLLLFIDYNCYSYLCYS